MEPEELIARLNLRPHPREGAYFAETYRSGEEVAARALPPRYAGARPLGTAIYFLITADHSSALHRLQTDEIYHFYLGDPVELLQLSGDGTGRLFTLGPNPFLGMQPQLVVPRGVWQGARLRPGGRFALLGMTTAPGFDYADYEHGDRQQLLAAYPQFSEAIRALTAEQSPEQRG